MNEKRLNEAQRQRIEEIKKEWFAELDKLEPFKKNGSLSHSSNATRIQLERKYSARIREVLKENNDGKG